MIIRLLSDGEDPEAGWKRLVKAKFGLTAAMCKLIIHNPVFKPRIFPLQGSIQDIQILAP